MVSTGLPSDEDPTRDPPRASSDGGDAPASSDDAEAPASSGRAERRAVLLRLDPAVHAALARWAADDLRSLNAQVELLLRRALTEAGRSPVQASPVRRPGRPRRTPPPTP